MVMMFLSGELMRLRQAYRDVVLPEPVGPVARMIPWLCRISRSILRSLSPEKPSRSRFTSTSACWRSSRRSTIRSPKAVGMTETRMSISRPGNPYPDSTVLGQPLFGDIQTGHYL